MPQNIEPQQPRLVESHYHNGMDSPRVDYQNLDRAPNLIVTAVVDGADARKQEFYDKFFIAPYVCEVTAISEVHTAAEATADPYTMQVQRLQGIEATGSGDDLLTTAFDLTGTAETVVSGTLVSTNVRILNKDDRLALRLQQVSGSDCQDVVVTTSLRRVDLFQ
jgi:hypothetical protein